MIINQKNNFCKIIKIEVISSIYGYMVGLVRVIHSVCVTGASLAQWHIVHALICTFRQFPLATCNSLRFRLSLSDTCGSRTTTGGGVCLHQQLNPCVRFFITAEQLQFDWVD